MLLAIRDLECTLADLEFDLLNFQEVSYIDSGGRSYPMVEMTRDGWQAH